MNIAEMDLDLSDYEMVGKEMFRGKPDCPQMVLSAKGIRFNRKTYDYFKGVEFYYESRHKRNKMYLFTLYLSRTYKQIHS